MVYPLKVRAYNTGGSPPFKADLFTPINTNEPYLVWLDYMLNNETSLPNTVSTSYGDNEQTVPKEYAETVCQRLAALGARGVTLLFASGDNGVGTDGTCVLNNDSDKRAFMPSFPVTCPFVTGVGGTKLVKQIDGSFVEEAAWNPSNRFASGGGYSNYFAMPDYQKSVVEQYTKAMGENYTGLFNASGRAYPDLAAQSQSYAVVWNGKNIILDGTSASCPTMAGVVSLLNDYLISNGKPPLGFMNPWLYKVGYQGFTDVLKGGAKGCDVAGFQAAKGWDAVTGFGTPVSFVLLY
jgi:tripeptidyl-peptidase-1